MMGTFKDPDGTHPALKGKTALLREWNSSEYVLAQFDCITLPEARGWRPFPRTSFDIRDEPAWDPWEGAASQVENPDIYATFARIINAQKWTGTIKIEDRPVGKPSALGMGYGHERKD